MLPAWLTKTVALVIAIGVALLLIAGLFAWHEWSASRVAKTETKLATGLAAAATESGHDSANTIGNRMDADAAGDTLHRENADANNKAEGGNVVVAAPATDTGLAGLCRHAAYSRSARCVQHVNPR